MKKIGLFIGLIIMTCVMATVAFGSASTTEDLVFSMLNQDPDPVEPGEYVELRFAVQNYGYERASSVLVEFIPEYPFSLDPGTSAVKDLGAINARQLGDEKITLFYKVRVDKDAIEGDNEVEIRYSVNNGVSWVKPDPFTVRVRTSDSTLSVNNVKTEPEEVGPGEIIKVKIELENRASSRLKDIETTLTLYETTSVGTTTTYEELPFTPYGNGVKKAIRSLDPGKTKEVSFRLVVDADADNKPYKIPITITYSDLFGQNFSQSNIVGIAVYDEPEYIVNLEESDIYVDGNKGRVIISISNTGPSDINYLTLKLLDSEDYEILSTDTIYVGNLESDDFETAEYDLFVKTDKKNVPLQLKMTYKDNYNNDFEKKIVLPGMKIFTQGEAVKFGLVKANSKAGMILPLMIFGLMALFWVYMFIDLRKNKNLPKYKKTLWLLAFIVANIVGAVLYYFIGKKKTQQQ